MPPLRNVRLIRQKLRASKLMPDDQDVVSDFDNLIRLSICSKMSQLWDQEPDTWFMLNVNVALGASADRY